jgi:phenylacetate-CoA ligase
LPQRLRWTIRAGVGVLTQGRFPYRTPEAIERVQRRNVRRAVEHAYEHVPYYRETMDGLALSPASFRGAADLARLPVIEREQLQRDPEYFVSRAQPLDSYMTLKTGGTSGKPVTMFVDPSALFQGIGNFQRYRKVVRTLLGRRPLRIRLAVIDDVANLNRQATSVVARRSLVPSNLYQVIGRMSVFDSPARNAELLEQFRPDVIGSFGSYLETLFAHLHEGGTPFPLPKVAVYSGDSMSERGRKLISEEFGIPVLSVYTAIEAAQIGFECECHSGIHLSCDLYPLRIVDPDGRECEAGVSGEVMLSNLVNRGTMLLNYRLGDQATMLPGTCPCGRNLPLLSLLEGRVDDWIVGPDGQRRHPQTVRELFTGEKDLWAFRIIQASPSEFTVQIVPAAGCDRAALRASLQAKFSERLGAPVQTEVEFVDSLPRTARGKVRAVVAS